MNIGQILLILGGVILTGDLILKNLTLGYRNNNPGNILWSGNANWQIDSNKWEGQVGVDTTSNPGFSYVVFANPFYGLRALAILAINIFTQNKYSTLVQFGNHYEGETTGLYGTNLSASIPGSTPNGVFDFASNILPLVRAIIINENTYVWYSEAMITDGVNQGITDQPTA